MKNTYKVGYEDHGAGGFIVICECSSYNWARGIAATYNKCYEEAGMSLRLSVLNESEDTKLIYEQ